jgi:D-alanyl-D-alanine carboxypeptidase
MISPSTNERLYANKLLNYSCSNQQRPPPLTKQKKRSNRQCILKQDEENNKNSMEKFSTTYKDARFSDDEKTRKW